MRDPAAARDVLQFVAPVTRDPPPREKRRVPLDAMRGKCASSTLNQLERLLRDSSVFCRTKGATVTAAIVVIG